MEMNSKALIFFLFFGWVGFSCEKEGPSKGEFDRLIEDEVQSRLDRWAKVKWARCEEDLLVEARLLADSIILAEAKLAAAQKEKPPKPQKPSRPDPVALKDSLPLEPIFRQDSLQTDSSNRGGK